MIATVLVATHNRSANLRNCLASLMSMEGIDGPWEILVVDNNSTDDTAAIVREFESTGQVTVRYLFEPRRGKSAALNTGISRARGALIAFTDDDCLASTSWLRSIVAEFQRDPELAVLGGRVELYDHRDKPIAIVLCPNRSEFDVWKVLDVASGTALAFGGIIGANMAVRRTVFEQLVGFDLLLSVGTKRGVVAEDLDFAYRACRAGVKVWYSPAPLMYHNHGRRTDSEVRALVTGYHRGRGAFYFKHILRGDTAVAKAAYWEVQGHIRRLWSTRFEKVERARRVGVLWSLLWGIGAELGVIGRSRM
jgi:GT2 family glycosyltransferase